MSPRRAAATAVTAVLLILSPVFFAVFKPEPTQAAQADIVSCAPEGNAVVCRLLNGSVILRVPIPTIKVPGPEIEIPGPTIRLPGPTVRVPGPTETVRIPGPTETVRIPVDTETVTDRPNNVGPSAAPTETVTATVGPTGQPTTSRDTVTASPEPEVVTETETRTKTETIVRNVLLGTLATVVLVGLGILALWIGYVLGYKGAERNEARSLRNMLDAIKSRGKHS